MEHWRVNKPFVYISPEFLKLFIYFLETIFFRLSYKCITIRLEIPILIYAVSEQLPERARAHCVWFL